MSKSPTRLRTTPRKVKIWIWLALLLGIAFASPYPWRLASKLTAHDLGWVQLLGKEVALAATVAAALALTIDQVAKKGLMLSFVEDVSAHIVGRILPIGVREYIYQMLQYPFVRKHWNVIYTIDEVEGKPDFVKVTLDSGCDIENRSEFSQKCELKASVNRSFVSQGLETEITHVSAAEITQDGRSWKEVEELRGKKLQQEIINGKDGQTFCKEYEFLPGSDSGCPFYHCHLQWVRYFHADDENAIHTTLPALDTTITVLYDKKNFEPVVVTPSMPLIRVAVGNKNQELEKTELAAGFEWHIRRPMLVGQGFVIQWTRKSGGYPPTKVATGTGVRSPIEASCNGQQVGV